MVKALGPHFVLLQLVATEDNQFLGLKLAKENFGKLFSEILSGTKTWSMKTSQPLVQVINNNEAIVSFTFDAESTEMNGTKTNESGALTYIWNKIDDKWKLIHIHESAK